MRSAPTSAKRPSAGERERGEKALERASTLMKLTPLLGTTPTFRGSWVSWSASHAADEAGLSIERGPPIGHPPPPPSASRASYLARPPRLCPPPSPLLLPPFFPPPTP